jgi:uncharacterized protein (DUF983 family)
MLITQEINSKDMPAANSKENTSIVHLLACKCPRCRKGDMFADKNPWRLKNTMKMNKKCPLCAQPLDIEVGFYFGAAYVSYALTVAMSAVTFIAWWHFIELNNENSLLYWLIANAVIMLSVQPYLMRVSRTGWLAFFVRYDPNWKINPPKMIERINKEQENNW